MTVVEFIKKKNEIIFKELGVTLVPEDQVVEVEKGPLSLRSTASACPYCQVYYSTDCRGCPMADAGNTCAGIEDTSSWSQFIDALADKGLYVEAFYRDTPAIVELYEEYNRQFNTKENYLTVL